MRQLVMLQAALLLQLLLWAPVLASAAKSSNGEVSSPRWNKQETSYYGYRTAWPGKTQHQSAFVGEFVSLPNATNGKAADYHREGSDRSGRERREEAADKTVKRDKQLRRQRGRQKKQKSAEQRRQQIAAAKTRLIGEFVREHGDAIRKSRRHADLFDGAGEMIDLVPEMKEFEDRAEKERDQEKRRRRKRRSASGQGSQAAAEDEAAAADSDEQDWPEFGSLGEALDHLNDGHQASIQTGSFNLRFVHERWSAAADSEKQQQREGGGRSKRSIVNNLNVEDGENDEDEDDDDDEDGSHRRQRDAASSLERLDAMLGELAEQLDEQAIEDSPFVNYHRRMTEAYKDLAQLRNLAQTMMPKQRQQQQQQQDKEGQERREQQPHESPIERLRGLFPEAAAAAAAEEDERKMANWQLDAGKLKESVQQLEQLYRQMDEL